LASTAPDLPERPDRDDRHRGPDRSRWRRSPGERGAARRHPGPGAGQPRAPVHRRLPVRCADGSDRGDRLRAPCDH